MRTPYLTLATSSVDIILAMQKFMESRRKYRCDFEENAHVWREYYECVATSSPTEKEWSMYYRRRQNSNHYSGAITLFTDGVTGTKLNSKLHLLFRFMSPPFVCATFREVLDAVAEHFNRNITTDPAGKFVPIKSATLDSPVWIKFVPTKPTNEHTNTTSAAPALPNRARSSRRERSAAN